ncbi:MAG: PRC-barrel domain-containing protein, partial [Brasilonema sp.]
MRRGSDLLGQVVVTYDTGEQIERIQDLIFDQDSNQLLGLLVDNGGLFRAARVIPFNNLQAIGPHAVVIPSKAAVVKVRAVPEIKAIIRRNNVLK